MKKTILFLTAALPMGFAIFTVQSCAGEGGVIGGGGGGGASIDEAFRALWTPEQQNASFVGSSTCGQAGCHGGSTIAGNGSSIYEDWTGTHHFAENVGCENCHGPGSAHAANPSKSNILTFPKVISAVVCAQCHGKIYDEWRQSGHALLVASPVSGAATNPASNGRSSRCVSCHSGLFRTQINERGIDVANMTDQEIRDVALDTLNVMPHTATCATCHDPHRVTGKLSKDGEELQLRHLVFNTDTTDIEPGTTAPTFTLFEHLCAQCHNGRGANGADSALQSGTARPNMHDSNQYNMLMGLGGSEGAGPVIRNMAHATAPGQCTTCHMPDARHTFTVSFDKGCAPCHTAADAAARTTALGSEITLALYNIRSRLQQWSLSRFTADPNYATVDPQLLPHLWEYSALLSTIAADLGTTTAGIPSNHQSANVPIEIKRARHNYYFIIRDSSICPHNPPYARHLINVANANLDVLLGDSVGRAPIRAPSLKERIAILEADKNRAKRADLDADEQ